MKKSLLKEASPTFAWALDVINKNGTKVLPDRSGDVGALGTYYMNWNEIHLNLPRIHTAAEEAVILVHEATHVTQRRLGTMHDFLAISPPDHVEYRLQGEVEAFENQLS